MALIHPTRISSKSIVGANLIIKTIYFGYREQHNLKNSYSFKSNPTREQSQVFNNFTNNT